MAPSSAEPTPALLTMIVIGPSRFLVSAITSRQASGVCSDAVIHSIPGCSAASVASSASVRATAITRAPRWASSAAVLRPMPRPAPVTRATRSCIVVLLLRRGRASEYSCPHTATMFVNRMPRYDVLSAEAMDTLEGGWRRLVSEIGIRFDLPQAQDRLRTAGQDVSEDGVVRFDPDFLLEQVAKAPGE